MTKLRSVLFLVTVVAVAVLGCAGKDRPTTPAGSFSAYEYPPDTFMTRVGRFIVLLDVSASMGETVDNQLKLGIAKDFLYQMNLTLPDNPDLKYAVRTFGHNPLHTISNTKLVKPFTAYRTADFSESVMSIDHTGGQSPMALAIEAAMTDLKEADGEIALLIFSDGKVAGSDAVEAMRRLKTEYGYRLSVYPVMIGSNPFGSRKMKEIAWVGQSGFYSNAADIQTREAMGNFVRRVFLARYPDTDGDTVVDIKDKCPNTPAGATVDSRGCWTLRNVEYAFDRWTIKPSYYPVLDKIVGVLDANPELKLEIQGHTDNIGTEGYNKDLSRKRAESVRRYLQQKGIAHDRLYTSGYGFSRPVASNETKEGRALNRRVELRPIIVQWAGF